MAGLIEVEVAYAYSISEQVNIKIQIEANKTIMDAILASNILQLYPMIDLLKQPVGIFGKKMALDTKLFASARVEIYQALFIDPKAARRERGRGKK